MGATILIVEDEADLVPALEYALQREGFRTVAVSSGQQALAIVRGGGVDLVLLDLMLPDLPGTEICRQLRASERTRRLPVIMMTARAEAADVQAGIAAGVDDYAIKPFRVRDLVQRVRTALRRRAAPAQKTAELAASARLG